MIVAALFVQDGGVYFNLPDVDPWHEARDARKYAGPHPVVAHPPCRLWVNFAALNYKRWGGEHNRPGADGGCFASALDDVRSFGGVLEHPAGSKAWSTFGLTRPENTGWQQVSPWEWVCEVWQSAYGHRARKRTWLLYHSRLREPPYELDWRREPGTAQIGWFDRNKPSLGKREASASPRAFAEALVCLARKAGGSR